MFYLYIMLGALILAMVVLAATFHALRKVVSTSMSDTFEAVNTGLAAMNERLSVVEKRQGQLDAIMAAMLIRGSHLDNEDTGEVLSMVDNFNMNVQERPDDE